MLMLASFESSLRMVIGMSVPLLCRLNISDRVFHRSDENTTIPLTDCMSYKPQ